MKPYGIPRKKDVECPDTEDIQRYRLKTSVGGRCCQRSKNKAISRRYWKKVERKKAVDNMMEELYTVEEYEFEIEFDESELVEMLKELNKNESKK
jgi:hypothetical protein